MKKGILTCCILLLAILELPAQSREVQSACADFSICLKTNMLYDALLVPNVSAELPLGRRWSVEAGWMYADWKNSGRGRAWRLSGGELGARYWLKDHGRRVPGMSGHHVGVYLQMMSYDFQFGGTGYLGSRWSLGAGVAYGYSLPVSRCLSIDFTVGVGYLGGKYKKYHRADNCDVWDSTHKRSWIGPTKAEVSLVWRIGRPGNRKGGSR